MLSLSFSEVSNNAFRITVSNSSQAGTRYCSLFTAKTLILGLLLRLTEASRAVWTSKFRLPRKWATNVLTHPKNMSIPVTPVICNEELLTSSMHHQMDLHTSGASLSSSSSFSPLPGLSLSVPFPPSIGPALYPEIPDGRNFPSAITRVPATFARLSACLLTVINSLAHRP